MLLSLTLYVLNLVIIRASFCNFCFTALGGLCNQLKPLSHQFIGI